MRSALFCLFILMTLPSAADPMVLRPPSPALQQRIRQWVGEWHDDLQLGSWPGRLQKERGVLLLHGNSAFLWYLTPQGQVLVLDTDRFGHPMDPEVNLRAALNAVAQASRQRVELRELLPPRPDGARTCDGCRGLGEEGRWGACKCHGLGWLLP